MQTNKELIESFYTAFSKKDYKTMSRCYHPEVEFEDPAFGKLKGKEVSAMWEMLLTRSKDISIAFSNVEADERTGTALWTATYTFSATGRLVTNHIHASFSFSHGLITHHHDNFDLNKWLLMAFGLKGYLFVVLPFLQVKFKKRVRETLRAFMEKQHK
jgi:ketosteroid isomerase-like protein